MPSALTAPADPCRNASVPRRASPVALVRSWDLVAGEHGPGTRLVLFTAGCPLRCVYCPNPASWARRDGRVVDVPEVMEQVERYRPLFDLTGGGVTLSGGEPLVHASFVAALTHAARDVGLHLTLATSGIGGERLDDEAVGGLGLVILDLKAYDGQAFRRTTGRSGGPGLRFAERVAAQGRPIRVKVVVVPGLTDDPAGVRPLAAFLAGLGTVEHVEVVPFERAAQDAWGRAGLDYPLARHPGPTHEVLAAVRETFAAVGLGVG